MARRSPALFILLLLAAPLLCGFESSARDLDALSRTLLQTADANPDCADLDEALDTWMREQTSTLQRTSADIADAIAKLPPEGLETARQTLNTSAEAFLTHPAHARMVACQIHHPRLEGHYESFLQATWISAHEALEKRARKLTEDEASRPADTYLAETSLGILAHYLPHYEGLVAEYASDCTRLNAAVDSWLSKHYSLLSDASKALQDEVAHMGDWDYPGFQPKLQTLTLSQTTLDTLQRCVDTLEDRDQKLLTFSRKLIEDLVAELSAATPR